MKNNPDTVSLVIDADNRNSGESRNIISKVSDIEKKHFKDSAWSSSSINDSLSSGCMIIYLEDESGRVPAYLICRIMYDEAEILKIAADDMGKGYGSKVMELSLELFRERKVKKIFLEVRASNSRATGLYKKYGFEELCIRKDYYHDPLEDALMMQLLLDEK